MSTEIAVLQQTIYAAFVLLSLITLGDWLRHRDRTRTSIALALGALALVVVASDADVLTGTRFAIFNILVLVLFPWSGYGLLLLRDQLVPLPARTKALATVTVATVSVAGLYLGALTDTHGQRLPLTELRYAVYRAAWILLWVGCVGEPIVRFWLESRGRAAVQRARLRALSLGYGLVVLILGFSYATEAEASNPGVQLVIQLVSLVVVPSLYASVAPPRWLRRVWRTKEEDAFGKACQELLLFLADRETLGRRTLEWAVRLVGAEGGIVVDAGKVLYAEGVDTQTRETLLQSTTAEKRGVLHLGGRRTALVAPWTLEAGVGGIAVVSGPYTPLFGADEVSRLEQYAVAVSTSVDRVRLAESLRESEESVRELNEGLEKRVQERTAELEASNKELEAFSYTVSHDLRAPLRVIDSMVDILRTDHAPEMEGEAAEFLHDISDNAKQMARLIEDLLTFSQLSRQPVTATRVAAREIVGEVAARLLSAEPGERQVEVTYGDLPECRTDPSLLTQVYANLMSNALKYTRGRPTAKIKVGWSQGPGPGGTYFVRDNGVGFDMAYHDKLFGAFQRLNLPEDYEGTGVGLAIVQRIITRHGGRVWAKGQPDNGATFHFTLEHTERT